VLEPSAKWMQTATPAAMRGARRDGDFMTFPSGR
jgi:hypothetical protein